MQIDQIITMMVYERGYESKKYLEFLWFPKLYQATHYLLALSSQVQSW